MDGSKCQGHMTRLNNTHAAQDSRVAKALTFCRLWRSQKPECSYKKKKKPIDFTRIRAYSVSSQRQVWRHDASQVEQKQGAKGSVRFHYLLTQTASARRRQSYSYEQQNLLCTSNQNGTFSSAKYRIRQDCINKPKKGVHEWLTLTLVDWCCRASTVSTSSICFSTAACSAC
jgi:hypothetical protein